MSNPKRRALVRVNSRNGDGFTALDLHLQNMTEDTEAEIYQLLHSAGTKQAHLDHLEQVSDRSFQKLLALLTVLALIAGSTYTSIFNLDDDAHATFGVIGVRVLVLHPHLLPPVFYSIVFMTFAFTASMVGMVVPLWLMIKEWLFYFQGLSCLGIIFFLSYFFILIAKVPKFWVTITYDSSISIQSFWLVWLSCLVLVLVQAITWFRSKMILYFGKKISLNTEDK
ncbi:hypothetical protein U1Q18_014856 [Sarracenia purpurea var. burkii]